MYKAQFKEALTGYIKDFLLHLHSEKGLTQVKLTHY